MALFSNRMSWLEARLEAIIEGYTNRLFPLAGGAHYLSTRLVTAMDSQLIELPGGEKHAPNLFLLRVHPQDEPTLREVQGLLDALATEIEQSGREAGYQFAVPPSIKLAVDEQVPPGQVQVEARRTAANPSETTTLDVSQLKDPASEAVSAYLVVDGRDIFPLGLPVINIGRRSDNHLVVPDPRVSRVHAQLRMIRGRYVIFDLDSKGGTYLNGRRITQHPLMPGDVISLSGVSFVYGQDSAASEVDPTATQPTPRLPQDPEILE